MSPELKEAFVELYGNWEFWTRLLPVIAISLITWIYIFIISILEHRKEMNAS